MRVPAAAGYLIGILIGLGVLAGGGILALRGLAEPWIVGPVVPVGHGFGAGGNLSFWVGIFLILIGFVIIVSVADVAIRTWEGEDFEQI